MTIFKLVNRAKSAGAGIFSTRSTTASASVTAVNSSWVSAVMISNFSSGSAARNASTVPAG